MINRQEEDTKEGYPKDPYKQTDKGKSLPVITVEKSDTLHETGGSQSTTTTLQLWGLHTTDKSMSRTMTLTLHDRLLMIVPINKKHKTGSQEWPDKVTKSRTWSCRNCGGKRIFKAPEPYGLGEGITL
jgi:hypothetical protein